MNKTIIIGIVIALVAVGAWLVFSNYASTPAISVVEEQDTIVATQQNSQNNTEASATPTANTVQYVNTSTGMSFSYPSNLSLEKDNSSTDPNVVNIGTQRLIDSASGKTYATIYDTPVAVGSMGTQTKLHKERNVDGKMVKMYYETSGTSEVPMTIGIGWDSENTAYIFFSPSQLPNNLKSLPDTVFNSLQLR